MMKSYLLASIILTSMLFIPSTLAYSGDFLVSGSGGTPTISELKSDIDSLNQDKEELSIESKVLNENDKLKSFFKSEISTSDLFKIKSIISEYVTARRSVNKKIDFSINAGISPVVQKNNLLVLKKNLYKDLLPFIDPIKTSDYLEYIEGDVRILKENKDVTLQLIVKKKELSTKVIHLEEKIKSYNNLLSSSLEVIIKKKIEEKIDTLKYNNKFNVLSLSEKISVLDKMLVKVELRVDKILENTEINEFQKKKIRIYQILTDRLESFKKSL